MKFKHHNRRGVTLLFVISIIVLFLLMGTAFVIVSNDFLKTTRRHRKLRVQVDHGKVLLERALFDLIRGPDLDNTISPLRGHSLLADMYGYGLTAQVNTATTDGSGHFITLTLGTYESILDPTTAVGVPEQVIVGPGAVAAIPGSMEGLLLTITSGEYKGLTTRIVSDQLVTGNRQLTVLPVWSDAGMTPTNGNQLVGQEVVVNLRPFSGTGMGYFNTGAAANAPVLTSGAMYLSPHSLAGNPVPNSALNPNLVGRTRDEIINGQLTNRMSDAVPVYEGAMTVGELVGANYTAAPNSYAPAESYDAFDFQNMFLGGYDVQNDQVIPSFFRGTLPGGGGFAAFGGMPEVDNDQDGVADSYWMDIGMPIQKDASGRYFKPLVAYYVVDQDGKINVNAAGNLSQVNSNNNFLTDFPLYQAMGLNAQRGAGYGPAEISLEPVFAQQGEDAILLGDGNFDGRYGNDSLPGATTRDTWSEYKLYGYPSGNLTDPIPGTIGNHFISSAMDIHGRMQVGYIDEPGMYDLDYPAIPIGMPVAAIETSTLTTEVINSAYETNFAPQPFSFPGFNGTDFLYSVDELEAILRPFDADANALSPRLVSLLDTARANGGAWDHRANIADRMSITTDSYEVPTTMNNLVALLYNKLIAGGVTPAAAPAAIRSMLAPEVMRGLPMDVNRVFGDGIDNDGNNVIDEMEESTGTESLTHPTGSVNFDHDNDSTDTADADAYLARANFARQLYVLTLLLTEREAPDVFDINQDGATDAADLIAYRRQIAQWAINVVDYRDPDSIMTAFEVDLNPWDGWGVDGDLATDEGASGGIPAADYWVAWGAERPELLMTETFAMHDRRTEDTDLDPTGDIATDEMDGVMDYDSRLAPNASAFIELYNPWVSNGSNQIFPGELYATSGAGISGVDLGRTAPGDAPVWRITVADADANMRDYDPDDSTNNPMGTPVDFLRIVYFTQPPASLQGNRVYFPNSNVDPEPVAPGRYAVVGSGGIQTGNDYTTYFGRRTTGTPLTELTQTRRLVLNPSLNQLTVYNDDDGMGGLVAASVNNVVCIPIDENNVPGTKRSLGFSDPVDGYAGLTNPTTGDPVNLVPIPDGFEFQDSVTLTAVVFDEPVDSQLQNTEWTNVLSTNGVWEDGASTTTSHRLVYLQRLANPNLAFNAVSNPYITVDSNSSDLFCFNGADDGTVEPNMSNTIMRFGTFERRSHDDPTSRQNQDTAIASKRFRMLFKTDWDGKNPQNDNDSPAEVGDFHRLNRKLANSLGVLNQAYRDAVVGGQPETPFAWLTWNNRPYISHLELANVPMYSNFWLTSRFDTSELNRDVYNPPMRGTGEAQYTGSERFSGHFSHLPNFYADNFDAAGMATLNGPELHRVMDYLEVPSRYVGTRQYVNPTTFSGALHGLSSGFAPPFDYISNYRYPGKLNLNTVTDPRVWNALMQEYSVNAMTGTTYAEWATSRKDDVVGSSLAIDPQNPFRAAHNYNYVPTAAMVRSPSECGLFRRTDGTNVPLFDFESDNAFDDTTRNAYFKYQSRQRLGNMATNRSSVFAIWVTVGFFEVDANGLPTATEIGADTGENRRHRAFCIFDRSIPVAFEPGQNHNVERAIRLYKYIE